jgi:hypothetical protein
MHALLKTLTLYLLLSLVFTASANETIKVGVKWSNKDAWVVKLEKKMIRTRGKEIVRESYTTSLIDISVIKKIDSTYQLSWTARDTKFGLNSASLKRVNELAEFFDGKAYLLSLNSESGEITLDNWKEIQSIAFKSLDVMDKQSQLANKQEKSTRRKIAAQIFDSQQKIEELFLKDVTTYFASVGLELTIGNETTFNTTLPSPFIPEGLPAKTTITLSKPDSRTYVVKMKAAFDEENMASAVKNFFDRTRDRKNLPPVSIEAIKALLITDEMESQVDIETGTPQKVSLKREVSVEDTKTIETSTFTIARSTK